jgi:hypothetical protein
MTRFPEWTPFIASGYLHTRMHDRIYPKQILRAITARVIDFVNPWMIHAGGEYFSQHVTDLIRRAKNGTAPIWQVYHEIYEYPSPCCRDLMLLLPQLSDKQLRIIHHIMCEEREWRWLVGNPAISHNEMTNFFRTIIRGHAAGVLNVDRMSACSSIAHFKKVIRRAVRRRLHGR